MAAQTKTPRSTGAASLESGLERLLEPALLVAAGALGAVLLLPLALVALPVYGALSALRTRGPAVTGPAASLCALPALAALLVAYLARGAGPADVVSGYVALQLGAGEALLTGWPPATA